MSEKELQNESAEHPNDEQSPEEADSLILHLSDTTFDTALNEEDTLLLVDFWADWCGPCHALSPVLDSLAEQFQDRIRVAKVNADQNRRLMDAFGVRSLPTVLLLRPNPEGAGAHVVDHRVGVRAASEYARMIEKALQPKTGLFTKLGKLFTGS